jgi:hypothetical protein
MKPSQKCLGRWCLITISLGLVVISFFLIWGIEQLPTPKDVSPSARSEAFAALAAAALTVVGSFHGHKMGRCRRKPQRMGDRIRSTINSGDRLRGIALLAITVVLVPIAWVVAEVLHVSSAAAAAVTGAILTITALDALHDMSVKVRTCDSWGWILFGLGLFGGLLLIAALPAEAEATAAIAAALMTLAGTHLGHTAGYKPSL